MPEPGSHAHVEKGACWDKKVGLPGLRSHVATFFLDRGTRGLRGNKVPVWRVGGSGFGTCTTRPPLDIPVPRPTKKDRSNLPRSWKSTGFPKAEVDIQYIKLSFFMTFIKSEFSGGLGRSSAPRHSSDPGFPGGRKSILWLQYETPAASVGQPGAGPEFFSRGHPKNTMSKALPGNTFRSVARPPGNRI